MIVMLLQQNLSKQSVDEKAETVRRKYLALTPMESLVPTTEMMQWLELDDLKLQLSFEALHLIRS